MILAGTLGATFAGAGCSTKTQYITVSEEGGTSPDDGRSDGGTPMEEDDIPTILDGAELTVTKTEVYFKLVENLAPFDSEYLLLSVTLRNVSSEVPLPMSLPALSLRTKSNLVLAPDPLSAGIQDSCTQSVLVEEGGSLSCKVLFLAKRDQANRLLYRLPSSKIVEAVLPPPNRCTALTQQGGPVVPKSLPFDKRPSGTNYAIPNGTYVRSAINRYSVDQEPIDETPLEAETLRINGSTFENVLTGTSGFELRLSGTVTKSSDGSYFQLKTSCIFPTSDDDADLSFNRSATSYFFANNKLVIEINTSDGFAEQVHYTKK